MHLYESVMLVYTIGSGIEVNAKNIKNWLIDPIRVFGCG